MTSRQDLLEAQAWARRRVLASLVSGEEPELPTAGRALLGGTAIAVVVALVVAAIALVG